jgi:DNA-directed RNA polymerase subunit L
MRFHNFKVDGSTLDFDIEDIDVSVVNSLRRIILAEIPNVGFSFDPNEKSHDIKVLVNRSSLHNEFLCHRISLIPLCFDEMEIDAFSPDKYTFVLKKINTTTEMMEVTTGDFGILDENGVPVDKAFVEKIFPKNPITGDHILITKLKPNLSNPNLGDEVNIEAHASIGIPKKNASFSMVSQCSFYNNIDETLLADAFKEFVEKFKGAGLDEGELRKRFETLDKFRHYKKNAYDEPISFHFTLQSECRLSSVAIFRKGARVLASKLRQFLENVDVEEKVKVITSQGMTHVQIFDEDHTLGNLLQAMFYTFFMRGVKGEDRELEYVGYYQPHPLENGIILKMKVRGDAKALLKKGTIRLIDHIESLITSWNNATDDINAPVDKDVKPKPKPVKDIKPAPVPAPAPAPAPAPEPEKKKRVVKKRAKDAIA